MTTSPWISVKDRLPKGGRKVLALIENYYHTLLICLAGTWYSEGAPIEEHVTHWMPLPDPPKPEDPFDTWWDSLPKYKDIDGREIPLRIIGEYVQDMKSARFIWDAAIASQKTDKQQP